MIILFISLCTGIIKVNMLEDISKFLLDHLSFFFIPAGVGILAYMDVLKKNLVFIIIIATLTTILVMVVTGHVVQFLARRGKTHE
jgi:holin-like protein